MQLIGYAADAAIDTSLASTWPSAGEALESYVNYPHVHTLEEVQANADFRSARCT